MATLRPIALSDLDLICRHRAEMFREAGRADADLEAMAGPFSRWLGERLTQGRYFGFIAEDAGAAIGGIGLMEHDWPPHPAHPADGRRGYVLNVFVEPPFRRKGIAKQLMQSADAAFAERGLSYVILHATDAGRPLYEQLGWSGTSEMAKVVGL